MSISDFDFEQPESDNFLYLSSIFPEIEDKYGEESCPGLFESTVSDFLSLGLEQPFSSQTLDPLIFPKTPVTLELDDKGNAKGDKEENFLRKEKNRKLFLQFSGPDGSIQIDPQNYTTGNNKAKKHQEQSQSHGVLSVSLLSSKTGEELKPCLSCKKHKAMVHITHATPFIELNQDNYYSVELLFRVMCIPSNHGCDSFSARFHLESEDCIMEDVIWALPQINSSRSKKRAVPYKR